MVETISYRQLLEQLNQQYAQLLAAQALVLQAMQQEARTLQSKHDIKATTTLHRGTVSLAQNAPDWLRFLQDDVLDRQIPPQLAQALLQGDFIALVQALHIFAGSEVLNETDRAMVVANWVNGLYHDGNHVLVDVNNVRYLSKQFLMSIVTVESDTPEKTYQAQTAYFKYVKKKFVNSSNAFLGKDITVAEGVFKSGLTTTRVFFEPETQQIMLNYLLQKQKINFDVIKLPQTEVVQMTAKGNSAFQRAGRHRIATRPNKSKTVPLERLVIMPFGSLVTDQGVAKCGVEESMVAFTTEVLNKKCLNRNGEYVLSKVLLNLLVEGTLREQYLRRYLVREGVIKEGTQDDAEIGLSKFGLLVVLAEIVRNPTLFQFKQIMSTS